MFFFALLYFAPFLKIDFNYIVYLGNKEFLMPLLFVISKVVTSFKDNP
jgi:hypothetical protein